MSTIDEAAQALREPFPAAEIGKLPRVTCRVCRENKSCQSHGRQRCGECANYITTAHIHLDYVGHAEITDRLLAVDPAWSWEPVSWNGEGLPSFDRLGGLWIRLTVAGVTRLGYGHADGKTGGDAVKEVIGDALRNAGMRFGVGLDMWRREPNPEIAEEPEADPAMELRHEIRSLGESKGYDPATIASDFATHTELDIRTAEESVLRGYLTRLQGYADATS